MNVTEAPLSDRLIAGASYGGFSIIGLFLNAVLMILLVRNRLTFSSNVFYTFVWHLMLGDMGILIAEVIVAMPLSLSGRPLLGEGTLRLVLSSIDTVSFYAILFTSFFLSLNRLTVFVAPRLNDILFKKPVVYIILAIPWIYGILWAVFTTLIGCPKTFFHEAYYFSYNCSSAVTHRNQQIYDVLSTALFVVPVVSLVFYIIIYMVLYFNASTTTLNKRVLTQKRKRERRLVVQALIICFSLQLAILGFTYIPKLAMAGFLDWYWITLFIGWIIILNSSINPIIYVVFNQSIRDAFKRQIQGGRATPLTRNHTLRRSRSSQPVVLRIPLIERCQSVRLTDTPFVLNLNSFT